MDFVWALSVVLAWIELSIGSRVLEVDRVGRSGLSLYFYEFSL